MKTKTKQIGNHNKEIINQNKTKQKQNTKTR